MRTFNIAPGLRAPLLWASITASISIFAPNSWSMTNSPSDSLPTWHPQLEFSGFHKQSDNLYKNDKGHFLQLRAEVFKDDLAKRLVKNKLVQLKLLFAPQVAAYPGMLTKDQSCITIGRFPKEISKTKNSSTWSAEMPGTEDFFYGSCGTRPEPFWSQYQVLYCHDSHTLYDIKYFVPKPKDQIQSHIGFQLATCPSTHK